MDDLLAEDNVCGRNLLRLASRGSAIIAELLRLSDNLPEPFLDEENIKDTLSQQYSKVLFDLKYIQDPMVYDEKLSKSDDLIDLVQELEETYEEILERFYKLFESIYLYKKDLDKFINDLDSGFYIMHSSETIMESVEGRQLSVEIVYMYGIMLIFLEQRIPGTVRERLLMALYRLHGGDSMLSNFEEIAKLCRNIHNNERANVTNKRNSISSSSSSSSSPFVASFYRMEAIFAKFPFDKNFIELLVGVLLQYDIYLMQSSFPDPEHRCTKLSKQGSMLFVILYFCPELLHKDETKMTEVVTRHFSDCWTISIYMGHIVDLMDVWKPFAAAKRALEKKASYIKDLHENNAKTLVNCLKQLQAVQVEGVLSTDYILSKSSLLLKLARQCNHALRWRLLHRHTLDEGISKIICSSPPRKELLNILLQLSQFEMTFKTMLKTIFEFKEEAWNQGKESTTERLMEVSLYFSGDRKIHKVKKDKKMMEWFVGLAEQVNGLEYKSDISTITGRKMQGIINALDDAEQFEAVDTSIQIKAYLAECKDFLKDMIKRVNLKEEIPNLLDNISDLSFAWGTLNDFTADFHTLIRGDSSTVRLLRSTVLKATSILDVPLVRIVTIKSPDAASVAEYYSSQLAEFVREVLGIIPTSLFEILHEIVDIQTNKMETVPIRFELKDMKEFAQLDLRYRLSMLTNQISILTEGILSMNKTVLGVIQVDPRQVLEEGLRRELVKRIAICLHDCLKLEKTSAPNIIAAMRTVASQLDGLKRSVQYIQDYIDMPGLKIYQQEFLRVINYNIEQEANRFIKKKTLDSASKYQSKVIPIPRLQLSILKNDNLSLTFMGRVMHALLTLTDVTYTVYVPEYSTWVNYPAPDQKQKKKEEKEIFEICSAQTFSLLNQSLGVMGLRGLDKLLAFRTVHILKNTLKWYEKEISSSTMQDTLEKLREDLSPERKSPRDGLKVYTQSMKALEGLMLPLLQAIRNLGQSQLLRKHIAYTLQFNCCIKAHQLYQAVYNFNDSLVADVKAHYRNPDETGYPKDGNPLLAEFSELLDSCGLTDPHQKIYVTMQPVEGLPLVLMLFIITYLPKLHFEERFGTLVRSKQKYPFDGAPLAAGIGILLKQFNPLATHQLVAYLGQFVRCAVSQVQDFDEKSLVVARNVLHFLYLMQGMDFIDLKTIERHIPASVSMLL